MNSSVIYENENCENLCTVTLVYGTVYIFFNPLQFTNEPPPPLTIAYSMPDVRQVNA